MAAAAKAGHAACMTEPSVNPDRPGWNPDDPVPRAEPRTRSQRGAKRSAVIGLALLVASLAVIVLLIVIA